MANDFANIPASTASATSAGAMSAADKTKLDTYPADGANTSAVSTAYATKTGTGGLVLADSPTFTTQVTVGTAAITAARATKLVSLADTLSAGGWFDARWAEMQAIDAAIVAPMPILGHGVSLVKPTAPTHLAWDDTVNLGAVTASDETGGYIGPVLTNVAFNPWGMSFRVANPAHDHSGGKYCGLGIRNPSAEANKILLVTSFDTVSFTKFQINYDGTNLAATTVDLTTAWQDWTIVWSPSSGNLSFLCNGTNVLTTAGAGKFTDASMQFCLLSNIAGLKVTRILLGSAIP